MQDSLTTDRQIRVPLRVAARRLRNLHTTRTDRIIRVTRTLRDMLRLAMGHVMDRGMVLIIAIAVVMVRRTGVGLAEYLFLVQCPNSNAEVQSQLRCGSSRWSIISPSLESRNGNMSWA